MVTSFGEFVNSVISGMQLVESVDLSSRRVPLVFIAPSAHKLETELALFHDISKLQASGIPCQYIPCVEVTVGEAILKAVITEAAQSAGNYRLVSLRTDDYYLVVTLSETQVRLVTAFYLPTWAEEALTKGNGQLHLFGPLGPFVA